MDTGILSVLTAFSQNPPTPRAVRAVALVLGGHVTLAATFASAEPASLTVRSATTPAKSYSLARDDAGVWHCPCADAARGHYCKHLIAAVMVSRALDLAHTAWAAGRLDQVEAQLLHILCDSTPAFTSDLALVFWRGCQFVRALHSRSVWPTATSPQPPPLISSNPNLHGGGSGPHFFCAWPRSALSFHCIQ